MFHRRVLQHIELNGCENVRAVNGAVADSHKTLTSVLASSNNTGANSIVPYDGPAESTIDMEAPTLPELLEPAELAPALVIKIDVEGAEVVSSAGWPRQSASRVKTWRSRWRSLLNGWPRWVTLWGGS